MAALVGVVMGSKSDWDTMRHTCEMLEQFGIEHDKRVLSAHRTPAAALEWASSAASRGIEVIIAAAGGAAHLAGVVAAHTILPVLGVPMETKSLGGMDSLLSTVQMPGGIPVGTLAIGKAGATNAALLAVAILALKRPELSEKLQAFRAAQTEKIPHYDTLKPRRTISVPGNWRPVGHLRGKLAWCRTQQDAEKLNVPRAADQRRQTRIENKVLIRVHQRESAAECTKDRLGRSRCRLEM